MRPIGASTTPSGAASRVPIAGMAADTDTQALIDTLTATNKLTDGIEFFIRLKTGMAALDSRGANMINGAGAAGVLSDAQTAIGGYTAAPLTNLIAAASLHIHDFSIGYFDKNGIPIPEVINDE